MVFLPVEPQSRFQCEAVIERIVQEEGLRLLGWRDTPLDADAIGRVARVLAVHKTNFHPQCSGHESSRIRPQTLYRPKTNRV